MSTTPGAVPDPTSHDTDPARQDNPGQRGDGQDPAGPIFSMRQVVTLVVPATKHQRGAAAAITGKGDQDGAQAPPGGRSTS